MGIADIFLRLNTSLIRWASNLRRRTRRNPARVHPTGSNMARPPEAPLEWGARFVSGLPMAVALFDRDGRYIAASAAWLAAFGLAADPPEGRRHQEVSNTAVDLLAEVHGRVLAGEEVGDYGAADQDAAGQWWGRVIRARPHRELNGTVAGVVVAIREARELGADEVPPTFPDPLTGLPGRHGFLRRLQQIMEAPDPARRSAVVL